MRVTVVTPPEPVITVEEAKEHLRVIDDNDQDTLITALVAAATGHIDGPEGWLSRAIGVQTLEARGPFFARCGWVLPYRPILSVETVKYLDPDGEEQTLAGDTYELRGSVVQQAFGTSWPSVRIDDESVRVVYRAGYEQVPAPIKAAILLMVGDLFRFRETAVVGTIGTAIPMSTTVQALLAPYRVYS